VVFLKAPKNMYFFGGGFDIANKAKSDAIGAKIHIRNCADELASALLN